MKLATYQRGRRNAKIGIVDADNGAAVRPCRGRRARRRPTHPLSRSMLALIDADEAGLDARAIARSRDAAARPTLWTDLAAAELLAPLPEPRQMRDAMSFALHIRQSGRGARAISGAPRRRPRSVQRRHARAARGPAGGLPQAADLLHHQPVHRASDPAPTVKWPRYSEVMDYELEIGDRHPAHPREHSRQTKPARTSSATRSSTTFPRATGRRSKCRAVWDRPRARASTAPMCMGPWIVTPDEIGDPSDAQGRSARQRRDALKGRHAARCCFPFEEIIAYASQDETIHAGEFFGSGTVGNCCGLEIGRFLESGDTIELRVDRIGVLSNRVAAPGASLKRAGE